MILRDYSSRLASLFFRVFSLGSKFILLAYMAKAMTPDDVGLYGLLAATVIWSTYLVGVEFHLYSLRELISGRASMSYVFSNQLMVYAPLYVVFSIIVVMMAGHAGLGGNEITFLLILCLIFEHMGQELSRMLIAVGYPLFSSFLLFLRSGLWPILLIFLLEFNSVEKSVFSIIFTWVAFSFLSLLMAFVFLFFKCTLRPRLSYLTGSWIFTGIKVGFIYWVSTLLVKSISVVDRYLIEIYFNRELLGIYVFFASIGFSLTAFMDTAIFNFMYPKTVSSYSKQDWRGFKGNQKKMLISVLALSLTLAPALYFITPLVLNAFAVNAYAGYEGLLLIVLISSSLWGVSMIPHYGLYAMKKDRFLFWVGVMSFFLFVALFYGFKEFDVGFYSIPLAVLGTYCVVVLVKYFNYSVEIARSEKKCQQKSQF